MLGFRKLRCHICKRINLPFVENDPNYYKVRDHNHTTKNFFDAANDICNRLRNVIYEILMIFNNFKVYD